MSTTDVSKGFGQTILRLRKIERKKTPFIISCSSTLLICMGDFIFRNNWFYFFWIGILRNHAPSGCCLVQFFTIWTAHLDCSRQHYHFELICSQIKLKTSYNREYFVEVSKMNANFQTMLFHFVFVLLHASFTNPTIKAIAHTLRQ